MSSTFILNATSLGLLSDGSIHLRGIPGIKHSSFQNAEEDHHLSYKIFIQYTGTLG